MYINIKNKTGFTLIETIVGVALGILVITTIMAVVTAGIIHIRVIRHFERLHSNAIFLVNTLTYWVKQGDALSVTSTPPILEIRLSPPSPPKIVTQNGDNITIDGVVFNSNDIQLTNLAFTKMPRSVQVNFTLKTKGANETFSATTTIAQRNIQ